MYAWFFRHCRKHHSDHFTDHVLNTMTSYWARWRLKSPASRLFTQPFIQAQMKENIKAPRHWPLCGEFTGDQITGLISTYTSLLPVLREARVAVYVSSNGPRPAPGTHRGMNAILMDLLDHAVGLEPWLAGNGVCTYPMPWTCGGKKVLMTPRQYERKLPNEEVLCDLDLVPSEGSYIHLAFGILHIRINSKDGHFHFQWGRLGQGKLYRIESSGHQGSVDFQVLWGAPYRYDIYDKYSVIFNTINEDGVVPAFGTPQGSTVDYFVRDALFMNDEWTFPNIQDEYQCNGVGTTLTNSLLWSIISSYIQWHIYIYIVV